MKEKLKKEYNDFITYLEWCLNWEYEDNLEPLEIKEYKSYSWEIIEILLAYWWPNIWLKIETERKYILFEAYRGGDELVERIPSKYYDTIVKIYSLN